MRDLPEVNLERLKDKANLSNTEIACLLLGWQGGTVYEVALETGLSIHRIMDSKDIESDINKAIRIKDEGYNDEECDQADKYNKIILDAAEELGKLFPELKEEYVNVLIDQADRTHRKILHHHINKGTPRNEKDTEV